MAGMCRSPPAAALGGPRHHGGPASEPSLTAGVSHDIRVHEHRVEHVVTKNITLSADESLIERARERARQQSTSLNAVFRQWLRRYVGESDAHQTYARVMANLEDVSAGLHFDRDELNDR